MSVLERTNRLLNESASGDALVQRLIGPGFDARQVRFEMALKADIAEALGSLCPSLRPLDGVPVPELTP